MQKTKEERNKWVRWLKEVSLTDVPTVGGKLIQAGSFNSVSIFRADFIANFKLHFDRC